MFFDLVEIDILFVVKEEDLIFDRDRVIKMGRIMWIMIGYLVDNSFLCWIDKFLLLRECFCFFNCFVIENEIDD